jgi:ribosomal protein S18 acetylase RimI-like enzyme
MTGAHIDRVRYGDLAEILRNYKRFWGELELPRQLHHPMFVIEFGETAFVARDEGGEIVGYLLGFVAPNGDGYIHLVAVRDDARRQHLGRRLQERFLAEAVKRGATRLKAITSPDNEDSLAFHRRMGFTDIRRVDDYGGSRRPRVIMYRPLTSQENNA